MRAAMPCTACESGGPPAARERSSNTAIADSRPNERHRRRLRLAFGTRSSLIALPIMTVASGRILRTGASVGEPIVRRDPGSYTRRWHRFEVREDASPKGATTMVQGSHCSRSSDAARRTALAFVCVALLLPGSAALQAQQAPDAAAPAPEPAASLPAEQLDSLVAPIALYPDALLAQVLAASTYRSRSSSSSSG